MDSSDQKSESIDPISVPTPLTAVPDSIKKSPTDILLESLEETGSVSSIKLKSKLRENQHTDVDRIVSDLADMNNKWKKIDRTFYTAEKAAELETEYAQQEEQVPSEDEESDSIAEESDETPVREKKSRRAREKRLCEQYIQPFLSSLYYTDAVEDGTEVAFCVQNQRPSTQFRNVDLIATNWRDSETVELVTVEAKLEFSAQAVQQAANYSRFSHRVWIAIAVDAGIEVDEIVPDLRETNALLFEYVLFLGLGVIACQKAKGQSYKCFAVQWPRKQDPDNFEKQTFLECYRETFEQAGILAPTKKIGNVA